MPVFVVPVDSSEENANQEAEITNQQIILGRNFLAFSCDDTRVSRNQGLLTHSMADSDTITIKSTHLNPIYYKVDGNQHVGILLKEREMALKHNDQFGFLPDKFWYKISIRDRSSADSYVLRIRPVAELNDSQNFAEIIPQVNGQRDMEISQEVSSQSLENNLIILPTPDLNVIPNLEPEQQEREVEVPQSSVKREIEDQSSSSPKRQRIDNDNPATSSTSTNNQALPCQSSESMAINQQAEPSSSTTTVKKEEPDSTDNLRDSCQFGIRCYRHNVEHRREFAHPGDVDYRRPNFPPAVFGTPSCSYGASCYRRNPDHFLEYAHPPSTSSASCSTSSNDPSSTNNMPRWLPKPKTVPKTEQRSDTESSDEENLDFSSDSDDDFQLLAIRYETSEEESDDNSAILDDGDANED